MDTEWTPPPAPMPVNPTPNPRRKRGMFAAAGLLGVGTVAGVVIGTTALSNAASTPSSAAGSSSSSTGSSTNEATERHGHGLDLSGTVTAVGSSTVTIKTATATTVYKVDSNSDIDKNGESSLSKLAVGDAVTFSVDSSSSTTIDKLHTGNESLNMPHDG